MKFSEAFTKMGEVLVGVQARRDEEAKEFLALHRELVETVPEAVVKAFGNLGKVALYDPSGKEDSAGIELTVEDQLWWKGHLAKGYRFRWGVGPVRDYMLQHLAKKVEAKGLTPEERKQLLALIDKANGNA